VEQFLAAHPDDHVRLLGIDPKAKQRQLEQTIQKPE
jgi:carbon dioxide concentrating mechanism protein CcmM